MARSDSQDLVFEISEYSEAEKAGFLFVEAIEFQFVPDYSKPLRKVLERGKYELFPFLVGGVACMIEIISVDAELHGRAKQMKQRFLLLARDRRNGWVYHHLMLLHCQGNVATRGTVLTLIVPDNSLGVLEELSPRKRRVMLL
jgi:hypothetical protein